MSLTQELVQLCHREEQDPGRDGPWTLLEDGDFQRIAAQLDAELGNAPLWLFAYGSLIWRPDFEAIDKRRATAFGWHRAFSLKIERWRGSRAQPGLMMALAPGGRCDGVIYRLPEGDRQAQIERLLRREVDSHEMLQSIRWLPVKTAHGEVRALSFWVGKTERSVTPPLPLPAVAATLARACGHGGSGAEYLYNTVVHLRQFGIHDRNLWQLQEMVAAEIRDLHGLCDA